MWTHTEVDHALHPVVGHVVIFNVHLKLKARNDVCITILLVEHAKPEEWRGGGWGGREREEKKAIYKTVHPFALSLLSLLGGLLY